MYTCESLIVILFNMVIMWSGNISICIQFFSESTCLLGAVFESMGFCFSRLDIHLADTVRLFCIMLSI